MFGDKLKDARLNKKFKQSDLAFALGIKNTTVSNWEKNISKPDVDTIEVLCGLLDVDANYFFSNNFNTEQMSIDEQNHIKKYRSLDDYGKKAVDSTLALEYTRVHDNEGSHFTEFELAFNYLTSIPTFAMGGYDIDKMDKDELIDFANDMYEMDQRALKLFK